MRLHLNLTPNKEPVPFNYQESLSEIFANWLRIADLENKFNFYSLSWLQKSKAINGSLQFPSGTEWFISFYDYRFSKKLVRVILDKPEIFYGMSVCGLEQKITPHFDSPQVFRVGSPVLAQENDDETGGTHFIYSEPKANEILTETLRYKMRRVGYSGKHTKVTVEFDKSYQFAKTKMVKINNLRKRGSVCPVIVKGTPQAVRFAWNVGVGHETEIGFGSLI